MIQQSHFWAFIQRNKSMSQRDISAPTFTTALFTTTKVRKQPNHLPVDEWVKKKGYVCTDNGILLHLKKGNPAICNNRGKPGRHYAK